MSLADLEYDCAQANRLKNTDGSFQLDNYKMVIVDTKAAAKCVEQRQEKARERARQLQATLAFHARPNPGIPTHKPAQSGVYVPYNNAYMTGLGLKRGGMRNRKKSKRIGKNKNRRTRRK